MLHGVLFLFVTTKKWKEERKQIEFETMLLHHILETELRREKMNLKVSWAPQL